MVILLFLLLIQSLKPFRMVIFMRTMVSHMT
jgi:hypothetical protein